MYYFQQSASHYRIPQNLQFHRRSRGQGNQLIGQGPSRSPEVGRSLYFTGPIVLSLIILPLIILLMHLAVLCSFLNFSPLALWTFEARRAK